MFFTKKELAERWKCSESAINSMIADGKLKPSRKLPGIKFSASQVLKIEEANPETMSQIECKKLTAEISKLKAENLALKKTLQNIWIPLVDYMKGVS